MFIETYEDLLNALQRGWKLCSILTFDDGTQHLYTKLCADARYIYWHHFGSSADLATARDMEFVVTVIFGMTLEEITTKYIWV